MSIVRTVLIGFGTAIVLGLPSLHHANAQYYEDYGGYGYDFNEQRRQRNEDIYQRQQRADQLLERELRSMGPPVHETEEFRGWDDRAARRRCNALTNNDAARSSCFEGLRSR